MRMSLCKIVKPTHFYEYGARRKAFKKSNTTFLKLKIYWSCFIFLNYWML